MLDRTDNDIYGIVLHLHPCDVAWPVVVRDKSACPERQVALELRIICKLRRPPEQSSRPLEFIAINDVVRHDNELARGVTLDQGVPAAFVGEVGRFEFLSRHISRVEPGTRWFRFDIGQKGLVAIQPIPWPVVNFRKTPGVLIGQRCEQ